MLLLLGEGAQGDHGGRLRWVQADLRDPSWDTLRREPALRDAFAERDRLWPDGTGTGQRSVGLAFHEAALLEAGFDEVGVVWQDLEERVLVALR